MPHVPWRRKIAILHPSENAPEDGNDDGEGDRAQKAFEAMMKKQHESLEQKLTVKMDTVLGTKLQEQDKKIEAVRSEID